MPKESYTKDTFIHLAFVTVASRRQKNTLLCKESYPTTLTFLEEQIKETIHPLLACSVGLVHVAKLTLDLQ